MRLEQRLQVDAQMLKHLGIRVNPDGLGTNQDGAGNAPLLYLQVEPHMVNALEFCHGGILYALADTACAYALAVDGFSPATVDASVTYVRAARLGERLHADTEILKQGARSASCDVRVHNSAGDLILVYRGTCANVVRS